MDKYYKVLNYLLDEIDCLNEQLDEAVHEHDYELAHLLQEALYLKRRELWNFKGIFDPVDLKVIPLHFPDKFTVKNKTPGKALQYILDDLISAKSKNIQLIFEKDLSRQGTRGSVKAASINISSNNGHDLICFTLQNFVSAADGVYLYEDIHLVNLYLIGWQIEDPETQRFSLSISKHSKKYQEKILEVLARTYFEVLGKSYDEVDCYVHITA